MPNYVKVLILAGIAVIGELSILLEIIINRRKK